MSRTVVLVVALLAVACQAETPTPVRPTIAEASPSATPTRGFTADDAIQAVLVSPELAGSSIFAPFPTSIGSRNCEIRGGGPPPGIVVPGTCRTEVERSGSDYVVRFTEVWDATRFHHESDPRSGELRHMWSFTVTASRAVVLRGSAGNFPPQWVR